MTNYSIAFLLFFVLPSLEYYSNKQASDCFTEKAVQSCHPVIKICTDDPQCQIQLAKYQTCSFGIEQQTIYNGYCFRKWREQAVLTKDMIECFNQQCDLEYNSVMGAQELFDCTKQAIVENFQECDEDCGKELNKIREKFNSEKIDELFSIPIENENARKIVDSIRTNCIQKQKHKQQKEQIATEQL